MYMVSCLGGSVVAFLLKCYEDCDDVLNWKVWKRKQFLDVLMGHVIIDISNLQPKLLKEAGRM